jgi:DnaJ-class molecular chaperone
MDPHKVLGISKDATEQEIKSAYKTLAKKHHPDKGGSEASFKELNEAYVKLTNPTSSPNVDPFADLPTEFQAMFKNMFKTSFMKGPLIRQSIVLTLEQIELGGTFTIEYIRRIPTGKVQNVIFEGPFGIMTGTVPEEVDKKFSAIVEIPKCFCGQTIVYDSLAICDQLPPSDIELTVVQEKHPVFTRINKLDLSIEIRITLLQALTGFTTEIMPLNSHELLKIECNSIVDPYNTKRIKGYGMNEGDLILSFIIEFPVVLNGPKEMLESILSERK